MRAHLRGQNGLPAHLTRKQRTRGRLGGYSTRFNDVHGTPREGSSSRYAPQDTGEVGETRPPSRERCSIGRCRCPPAVSRVPYRSGMVGALGDRPHRWGSRLYEAQGPAFRLVFEGALTASERSEAVLTGKPLPERTLTWRDMGAKPGRALGPHVPRPRALWPRKLPPEPATLSIRLEIASRCRCML